MTQQTRNDLVIDQDEIHSLRHRDPPDGRQVRAVLARAGRGEGLGLEEAATLLAVQGGASLGAICDAAREVKEKVFGKRIVLFAPLYISNRCRNNCLYCGFRRDNREADRRTLSVSEIVREAGYLYQKGYRRLLVVAGEHPEASTVEALCAAAEGIYRGTGIRIVHVNAAPMEVGEFARLKASGVGVYQCFQETYHSGTYARMHPSGPKSDFDFRLSVMDRAMEGGFGDVGMGALFGLYDYRFEVLSVIAHARHLEERFGVGPHTISVPRLRPAVGALLDHVPSPVTNEEFKKIVAVFRLAVPYAGVVVSTREEAALRDQVIHVGASQISAGSRTDIGGYSGNGGGMGTSQFSLADQRSLEEIVRAILKADLLPSLCTACYRSGRVGEHFRAIAEKGGIKSVCFSNALFSLMEYLGKYAGEETRTLGRKTVEEALARLEDGELRRRMEKGLKAIAGGEEDVHF